MERTLDRAGTDRHFQALASTLRWEAFSGGQQKSDRSCFHGRDDPGCCVEFGPDRSRAEAEIASESYILKRNEGLLAFPYLFLDSFSVYQCHLGQIATSLGAYIFLLIKRENWFKVIFTFLPILAMCEP